MHHTNCGLQLVTEDGLKAELEAELGLKPWWAVESFEDPYVDVRQSMKRLEMTPFVTHKDHVRGFVYDVSDGPARRGVPARTPPPPTPSERDQSIGRFVHRSHSVAAMSDVTIYHNQH